jgi:hypothetical protein
MQVQSPSLSYQIPQLALPTTTSTSGQQIVSSQNALTNQLATSTASEAQNPLMGLLNSVINRVLDFAFNVINQLVGAGNCGRTMSAMPVGNNFLQTGAGNNNLSSTSPTLTDIGKGLATSLTTLIDDAVGGLKNFFNNGIVKTASSLSGFFAGLF